MTGLSGTQVKNAGKVLRVWWAGDGAAPTPEIEAALQVLVRYRALHYYPLAKATMGLRSRVETVGARRDVAQRLKRAPTILSKLVREPNMQLSTMQDIAGCRAVLDSVTQLRAVQERFKTETIVRLDDYIERPKASGYRGVHLVVRYTDRHGGSRSEFSFGRRSSMTGRSPLSRWGARLTAS